MKKRQFVPTVDGTLESRVVMSSGTAQIPLFHGLPILTTHTYYQVLVGIDNAFRRYGRSNGNFHDQQRLTGALVTQANRVPYGNEELVPFISESLDGITPHNSHLYKNDIKNGLNDYIAFGLSQPQDFVFLQSRDRHSSDKNFPRNGKVS
jgi:hypothetical protein